MLRYHGGQESFLDCAESSSGHCKGAIQARAWASTFDSRFCLRQSLGLINCDMVSRQVGDLGPAETAATNCEGELSHCQFKNVPDIQSIYQVINTTRAICYFDSWGLSEKCPR